MINIYSIQKHYSTAERFLSLQTSSAQQPALTPSYNPMRILVFINCLSSPFYSSVSQRSSSALKKGPSLKCHQSLWCPSIGRQTLRISPDVSEPRTQLCQPFMGHELWKSSHSILCYDKNPMTTGHGALCCKV